MSYMRSEVRAKQILDCAKRVFAERGFHAANVSHICEAAGIGRGTLYQYFTNKRSVLEAILRETLERVKALMGRQSARTVKSPPPEKITRSQAIEFEARALRELLGVVFADEHTLRILLREAVGAGGTSNFGTQNTCGKDSLPQGFACYPTCTSTAHCQAWFGEMRNGARMACKQFDDGSAPGPICVRVIDNRGTELP
jgi:AcrR family transcriptional regulator